MAGIDKTISQNIFQSPNKIFQPLNPDKKPIGQTTLSAFELKIDELERTWKAGEKSSEKLIGNIPPEFRAIFQAQVMASRCNFQAEFVTKLADAVSGAIKKLSQNQ